MTNQKKGFKMSVMITIAPTGACKFNFDGFTTLRNQRNAGKII